MSGLGIEHHGRSKSIEALQGSDLHVVITVSNNAVENCPVWLGRGRKIRLGFRNPAKAEGSEEDGMPVFRAISAEIADRTCGVLSAVDVDQD